MIPMMVKMKMKLMVGGDYEDSDSADDESDEYDLDDIIFDHDDCGDEDSDCAYDDNEEYSSRTILSHDDCDEYDNQGWASCVSACHKERKSVQPCHPDCGGQKSSIS